jgi:translation initiation factor IF-1
MAKEEILEVEGVVVEVLPSTTFKVKVKEDVFVMAHLSGKMRQNNIKVLLGDEVKLEMSVYDLSKGRIVYRK